MGQYPQSPGDEDAFDNVITVSHKRGVAIDSQYNFSPERVKIDVNGSNPFPQYNSVAQFVDASDTFNLVPNAGDTVGIETAESTTYVPNHEIDSSLAFQLNQPLQSGDILRWGPFISGTDGWYIEQRGADHTADQADIIELRNGIATTLATDVELNQPTTDYTRYNCRWNWYNVGRQKWTQTFTQNGQQSNALIEQTSNDGGRGPEQANLPIRVEVVASGTTTGLQVNVGSMNNEVVGDVETLKRVKPQQVNVQVPAGDNIWHPVYALRIDPNDLRVNADLENLEVLSYAQDGASVELLAKSVAPSKTDATGWQTPEYMHAPNTAIQSTTTVTTVPSDSGVVTDPSTTGFKPGGFTVAFASLGPAAIGSNYDRGVTKSAVQKIVRPIYESDVLVFLARASTAGNQMRFHYDVIQNW